MAADGSARRFRVAFISGGASGVGGGGYLTYLGENLGKERVLYTKIAAILKPPRSGKNCVSAGRMIYSRRP
jgi:hypothetical protein